METILLLGVGIFSLSSLYFLVTEKKSFNTAFFVSFITIISYTLMLEGSLTTVAWSTEPIYYSRWFFYGISCTLLAYVIAQALGKSLAETAQLLYLTAIVMATGGLAAIFTGPWMLTFFALGTIAYLLMVYPILTSPQPAKRVIAPYILLGWSVFPIIFIIAPEGYGLISNVVAGSVYLALDVLTKIIFYVHLRRHQAADQQIGLGIRNQ